MVAPQNQVPLHVQPEKRPPMARHGHRPLTCQPAQPLTPCPTAKTNRYKKNRIFTRPPIQKQIFTPSNSLNQPQFFIFTENSFFKKSQSPETDPMSCAKNTQRRHPMTASTALPLSDPPVPRVDKLDRARSPITTPRGAYQLQRHPKWPTAVSQ